MMKANILKGINNLCYEEIPKPNIPQGWVLINVKACGICGSDVLRVFTTGTYHFPTSIGHEFAGVVANVSNSEDECLIGHRVSVFPLIPCMDCSNCKEGKYELCSNYNYLGSRCDGGFAEYVAVPKWNILPISDNVSMPAAAMFEPAAVGLHALKHSNFQIGDTIAIVGPGTIGMILCQLAKLAGASRIILIGRSQIKLDYAKKTFNVDVINSKTENVLERINDMTENKGVNVAIEGTGASESLNICFDIVSSSGNILVMGNPLNDMILKKVEYWKVLRKQLTIHGTWNSSFGTSQSDWTRIHSLVASNQLKLESLITHKLPLSKLLDGLNLMKDDSIYTNKVMIVNE